MKYETTKKIPKRLKKVEELFDVASEVLEKCNLPESPESSVEIISANDSSSDLEVIDESTEVAIPRLFRLEEVRHDFEIARRNLYRLLNKCQNLMDGVSGLDVHDMTGIQIQATAMLSNSITVQIQTVMSLYKDLTEIEKMRTPPSFRNNNINNSSNDKNKESEEENSAVYIGDSKSLLDIIRRETS
jgi:hypothetical protein